MSIVANGATQYGAQPRRSRASFHRGQQKSEARFGVF